jgi:polyhydroxyalkanoate synthesis regulator phasin
MPANRKTSKTEESLLDQLVVLGSSLAYLTKGAADELFTTLEKHNIISPEGKDVSEKIKHEFKQRQEKARKKVIAELGKVVNELDLVTKKDLEALKKSTGTSKKTNSK